MKKQIAALTLALAASIFSMTAMADVDHNDAKPGDVIHHHTEENLIKHVAATCTKEGYSTYKCEELTSDNGWKVYIHTVVEKIQPHTYGDWTVTKPATCWEQGTAIQVCQVCGHVNEKKTEIVVDLAGNNDKVHEWDGWVVEKAPTCKESGYRTRVCLHCPASQLEELPALSPEWELKERKRVNCFQTTDTYVCKNCNGAVAGHKKVEVLEVVSHSYKTTPIEELHVDPTCTTKGYDYYECVYAKDEEEKLIEIAGVDPSTGAKLAKLDEKGNVVRTTSTQPLHSRPDDLKVVEIPALGHKWSAWIERVKPGQGDNKLGVWARTCERCGLDEEVHDTKKPDDTVTPTEPEKKNGLYKDADGVYRHYTDGKVDTFTGIAPFQGGEFFVANGVLCSNANGLNQNVDGKWYFLSQGQIQKVSQTVSYGKDYFQVTNGELDVNYNGIHEYDGGQFLFAAGKLRTDVQGLWQAADGTWYFLANGQVQTQYKGLALYDGHWFYVDGGKFDPTFAGKVEHDGATFDVVNGQVF